MRWGSTTHAARAAHARRRRRARRAARARTMLLAATLGLALTAGLAAAVTLVLPARDAAATSCPTSGAGTPLSPYLVQSKADFELINGCGLEKHYYQTVDLDLGNVTPIGTTEAPFTGEYRGVVSAADLTLNPARKVTVAIDAPDSYLQPVGLFSRTSFARITHLTIEGTVTGRSSSTGGIIGDVLDGLQLSEITADVTVRGTGTVGGLVGRTYADEDIISIQNVTSRGSVLPLTTTVFGFAGGLIGEVNASSDRLYLDNVVVLAPTVGAAEVGGTTAVHPMSGGLIGSSSTRLRFDNEIRVGAVGARVQVVGSERAGGLIGSVQLQSETVELGALTVHADVTAGGSASDHRTGGLIGLVHQGSGGLSIVGPATFAGTVTGGTGSGSSTGGAIGRAASTGTISIMSTTIDATVDAPAGPVGGIVGSLADVTRTRIGEPSKAVTVAGGITASGSQVGGVVGYTSGLGTADDDGLHIHSTVMLAPIQVTSRQGTGGIIGVAQGSDGERVRLTAVRVGASGAGGEVPITVSGTDLGDGRMTTILAGGLVGGALSDVRLTIEDSEAYVTIGSPAGHELDQAGGIIGAIQTSRAASIRGNTVGGTVAGHVGVGGIAGGIFPSGPSVTHVIAASGAVPNTVTATVTGRASVGGAVGVATGAIGLTISDIIVDGPITAAGTAGGIVGTAALATLIVTDADVFREVTGVGTAGGIVGAIEEGVTASITDSRLDATVTASAEQVWSEVRVGGVVGATSEPITASGLLVGPSATVRAVHPTGTADGAVFLSGGLLLVSYSTDPASVDVSGLAGMLAALDVTQVSPALRDAGRCVVSTTATLTRWTSPGPGIDELEIRRVDTPSPDPCPPPAGGFAFRFVNDDDDDGTVTGNTGAGADGAPTLTCDVPALRIGATVTCTVTGAPPAADIVWRASVNPTVAEGVLRTGADGSATFAFVLPATTSGRSVRVELVEWTGPLTLGVVGGAGGGAVPRGVPAGEHPSRAVLTDGTAATLTSLALLALLATVLLAPPSGRRAQGLLPPLGSRAGSRAGSRPRARAGAR